MSELKLFSTASPVKQLQPTPVALERNLQQLVEANMDTFFGVHFLRSEWPTTDGRMDSIGIDENNCPVIFEYKRGLNENVINQGLFYLDWLMDHKASFESLVEATLGKEAADKVDWSNPCVMCIANDFTRYDVHAVNQMGRLIKLIRYYRYGDELILFEYLNAPNGSTIPHPKVFSVNPQSSALGTPAKAPSQKTHAEKVAAAPPQLRELYDAVCRAVENLGDDVSASDLKFYRAYRRLTNLACLELHQSWVYVFLKLDPDDVVVDGSLVQDVRNVGHLGTGDLRIKVSSLDDLEKVQPLLEKAYSLA